MKKLTTTILILFVCFGCIVKKKSDKPIIVGGDGQTKGAASFNADDFNCDSGIITIDYDDYAKDTPVTGYLSREDFDKFSGTVNQYDTQKVIMLVCDTVNVMRFENEDRWIVLENKESHRIHWQYGNKVTSKHGTGEIEYSHEDGKWIPYPVYDYDFVNYLDADKKPLSKSIIVWQTKELK